MAVTYQGVVVLISATDVSDESTTFNLTPETDTPSAMTFAGQVSAQGATTWSGELTAVYDNTAGSAYKLLLAEAETPTAGGKLLVFRPEGSTSGKESIQVMAVVGYPGIEAEGDGGVQLRTFPFSVTGTPTFTAV